MKKLFLVIILLFISLSCVNAADVSDNLTSSDNNDLNPSDDSALNSLDTLTREIYQNNGTFNLTKDYAYHDGDSNIVVSRDITLNGGGHSIDVGNLSFVFKIDENAQYSISLNNIIFKNCKSLCNKNQANIKINNCDIFDKSGNSYINFPEHNDPLTFEDLNDEILKSDGVVNLNESYHYSNGEVIKLYKNITINGNGNLINAGNSQYIFELVKDSSYDIIIKDIVFENFNELFNIIDLQLTMIDCDFKDITIYNNKIFIVIRSPEDSIQGYCDAPSEKIIQKARSIVGFRTGLDAAKALANWVKKNIKHEAKAGFYQSPDQTLKRGKGNCCVQTELFLLMCIAVGVDKECKLSFVHYGNMYYKQRHFFALVDNVCVDVDGGYNDPWAHGVNYKRNVFNITNYPLLPIAKNY